MANTDRIIDKIKVSEIDIQQFLSEKQNEIDGLLRMLNRHFNKDVQFKLSTMYPVTFVLEHQDYGTEGLSIRDIEHYIDTKECMTITAKKVMEDIYFK